LSCLRLALLGVGAMNSPRYHPAGLLLSWPRRRIMFDGGGAAVPAQPVDAWLVTDARAELIADIRRRCRAAGLRPEVGGWAGNRVLKGATSAIGLAERGAGPGDRRGRPALSR
jgi:hypothetical protein